MNLLSLSVVQIEVFFLIFIRVTTLFLVAPIFSSRNIPPQVKIWTSFFIALILYPFATIGILPDTTYGFILLIGREILLGLVIGSIIYLLFVGVQLAGQVVDLQIGFGIANVIDPLNSMQISILGQFYYIVALLIFLCLNGHYILIEALVKSFTLIPLGKFVLSGTLVHVLIDLAGKLFMVALQIGGPVMIVLLLTNIAFGIIARTIPQLNILMTGLPINALVGIITILLTMAFFLPFFQNIIKMMWENVNFVLIKS